MWFPDSQRRHRRQCSRSDKTLIIYLLWFITFSQLLSPSVGFFFPLFANFFNKLRGNVNQNRNLEEDGGNGGASLFGGGSNGNATSIRVPMLRSAPERRIDVVTTVVNNAAKQEPQIQVLSNVSTTVAAEALLNSKLVAPTSTSITKSVSMSKNKLVPSPFFQKPPALTLPFTPNLFGVMSYVQALKDIKRNYKIQEKERQIEFLNREAGGDDLMTRILRTLIQKVVNKYQKQTEILKLKILKRQQKLQHFLQLPMVAQVIAADQAGQPRTGQTVPLGKGGVPPDPVFEAGKRTGSILNSFLI